MSTVAASQDASNDFRMKRWCLELSMLPTTVLHRPWEVPTQVLQAAGVVLGEAFIPHVLYLISRPSVKNLLRLF